MVPLGWRVFLYRACHLMEFSSMNAPSEYILRKDALELMRKKDANGFPVPFTLRYVTFDKQRNTGGELREVKATMPHGRINKKMYRNAIRHIRIMGVEHPVPVHIYLMTRINNKWIL